MKTVTTKEAMYEERRQYVTSVVREALAVIPDFGDIQYAHEFGTDQEYVKIYDIIGGVLFLDVTGASLEAVLTDVAYLILHKTPKMIISDRNKKLEIARLFVR